ncbi:hypothetical protein RND81_04G237600 [Saponaria officinalis]|uniref:Ubiquitin-like protease family profile domain-containing protein n=1 Tax=Saponaria officinalis TaxID=3572 RepID=A0AAW1LMS4_SAPOF
MHATPDNFFPGPSACPRCARHDLLGFSRGVLDSSSPKKNVAPKKRQKEVTKSENRRMDFTRAHMQTLLPGCWLYDTVIDMAGICATHLKPEVLYVPTTLRFLKSDKNISFPSKYIKTTYMPEDASECKKVFFLILTAKPDHWLLCVYDLAMKTNYILDSMAPRRTTIRNKFVTELVFIAALVLSRGDGFGKLKEIILFPYVNMEVQQQNNGHDCGIYVIKWIEALMDKSLWNNQEYFTNLKEYRRSLMIKLLRREKNKIKEFA